MDSNLIRLNKFISLCGISSRRNADKIILQGKIKVNGKVVKELGTKINQNVDKVFFHEQQIIFLDKKVYIVFNKPKNCITTLSDEKNRETVLSYINVKERIFPIGRLDKDTTGVLLLTNDGEFANKLMHPKFEVPKTYLVKIDKPISVEDIKKLEKGIKLEDGITSPSKINVVNKREVLITIHEGKNKQVRRMFEALEYEIKNLHRVEYASITCDNIPKGKWKYLTKRDLTQITKLFF